MSDGAFIITLFVGMVFGYTISQLIQLIKDSMNND